VPAGKREGDGISDFFADFVALIRSYDQLEQDASLELLD
jgi:hypothetical protein